MADVNVNIKSIDNTNAGFASANRNLQRFAKSAKNTTSGLMGTVTGAGLGSALGSALGINLQTISDSVARMLTGVSKDVENAMERMVAATGKAADLTEQRMRMRRTDEQQLVVLLDRQKKLYKQLDDIKKSTSTSTQLDANFNVRTITTENELTEEQIALRTELGLKLEQNQMEQDQIANSRNAKLDSLRDKLKLVEDQSAKALAPLYGASLKGREQLESLRQGVSRLEHELAGLEKIDTESALLRKIELNKKLTNQARALVVAEAKALEAQKEAAKILGSGFEKAIVNGEKFGDVLQQIGRDLMQLAIRNAITNPLIEALGGSSLLGGLFGGFRAGGGPVTSGKSYVVGERGPEIFSPSSSGTIIPNGGGGGGGSTYYIDARGADRSGLARLEQMINQTQASIRPIALASVVNASARGII